ncbi:hypothetical protein EEX84_10740 [Planococcus salinus]|uniref:Uncharacterized protein n=1 Tax=Planococcus salinus TaxID=1848460 RepID=A0A3M8P7B4_9BACL|nr:hypothetical protein EEX84_10740 [Planococcus salinus]
MKGFLSLLGITLIVGAFGLISLSFYGNPLEELKSQQRMQAYIETRQNHSADSAGHSVMPVSTAVTDATMSYFNFTDSCERLLP